MSNTTKESLPRVTIKSYVSSYYKQEDGVIVTWDLREPDSLHKRVVHENVEYVLRHPTYNTGH